MNPHDMRARARSLKGRVRELLLRALFVSSFALVFERVSSLCVCAFEFRVQTCGLGFSLRCAWRLRFACVCVCLSLAGTIA